MIEAENWKIALKLYDGHPIPASLLAHQLNAIKQCLERGRKGIPGRYRRIGSSYRRSLPAYELSQAGPKIIQTQNRRRANY